MTTFHRNSIRSIAVVATAAALVAAGSAAAAARPGGVPAIPVNNGQETTGADTGASGFFSYDIDGGEFCYTLEARNLSVPAGAAHIHLAPRTVAGPIVLPLTVGTGTDWTVSECVPADPALLDAISSSPRSYYVNVHTPTFPGGEIRGQLK
ncbi:MAG: CHRD domain-containing protein [Mycetocola sp.]